MSDATTGVPAANASVSTMPNLSPPSDGATRRSASRSAWRLRSSATLPSAWTPRRRAARRDSVGLAPTISARPGGARAAPRRRAAGPAGPCARPPGRRRRAAAGPPEARGLRADPPRDVDAVGDHAVAAAVEAPPGPGRRLGHRDPHAQAVQPPAGAGDVALLCEPVRPSSSGTCRRAARRRGVERVPADDRARRLVDVDHVVGAVARAPCAGAERVRRRREVRHRAVRREAERPAERDEPFGHSRGSGRAPPVQPGGEAIGRVERGEHRDVVAVRRNSPESASMCRVTPPGYVHEYGDTKAMRISRC